MAKKAKAKRQGPPTWSEYLRSRWGVSGGCYTAQAARQWVAEQEAAGRSAAAIWRTAAREHSNWTAYVWSGMDDDVYPADMLHALTTLTDDHSGWSPAFRKAINVETKRLVAMDRQRDKFQSGKAAPRLVRVGRRVDATLTGMVTK